MLKLKYPEEKVNEILSPESVIRYSEQPVQTDLNNCGVWVIQAIHYVRYNHKDRLLLKELIANCLKAFKDDDTDIS